MRFYIKELSVFFVPRLDFFVPLFYRRTICRAPIISSLQSSFSQLSVIYWSTKFGCFWDSHLESCPDRAMVSFCSRRIRFDIYT